MILIVLRLHVKFEPDESMTLSAAITGDIWWDSLMDAIYTRAHQQHTRRCFSILVSLALLDRPAEWSLMMLTCEWCYRMYGFAMVCLSVTTSTLEVSVKIFCI